MTPNDTNKNPTVETPPSIIWRSLPKVKFCTGPNQTSNDTAIRNVPSRIEVVFTADLCI
jgi:hypothetical protein